MATPVTTFGGTYPRTLLPESEPVTIRIRRVYCQECSVTHAVLPACLFEQVRYSAETLAPYLESIQTANPGATWQQNLVNGPDDVSTLYRWFRRLKGRLRHLIPLLQQTLLELAPDTKLEPYQNTILQSATPASPATSSTAETLALCQLSFWLAGRLLQVTDQLTCQPTGLSVLAFLNYFSWRKTGQCLLSPPANAPPETAPAKPT